MDKNENWAINVLIRLTSTFFITPSYNFIMCNMETSYTRRIICSIMCAISLAVIYVVYLQFSINAFYIHQGASSLGVVVDSLSILSYTVLAIVTVLSPVFHMQSWKQMFILLQEVSEALNCNTSQYSSTNRKWFVAGICVIHVAFIAKIIWNIIVWLIYEKMDGYVYYIPVDVSEYLSVISMILVIYLNKIIRHKYAYLNNFVKRSVNKDWKSKNIRSIRKNYRKLGTAIQLLSKIFGYQMLCVMETTIISILESFYYALRQQHNIVISWCVVYTVFAIVSL